MRNRKSTPDRVSIADNFDRHGDPRISGVRKVRRHVLTRATRSGIVEHGRIQVLDETRLLAGRQPNAR